MPPCPQTGYWYNCVGERAYADGSKYVGEWRDNRRDGYGTNTFPNGETYVGEWKDDKRNGQGTLTGVNGLRYGVWSNDILD